jgi:hypothetical protein
VDRVDAEEGQTMSKHDLAAAQERAAARRRTEQNDADLSLHGNGYMTGESWQPEAKARQCVDREPQHEWSGQSMHDACCRRCGIAHAEYRSGATPTCLYRVDTQQASEVEALRAENARLTVERGLAQALNVTIESMGLERMNAVGAIEHEKVAAERQVEALRAALEEVRDHLTAPFVDSNGVVRHYAAAIVTIHDALADLARTEGRHPLCDSDATTPGFFTERK